MLCRDVMKKDVECVSPRDTVLEAAARMRRDNVGFLPVCDEDQRILGTVTDRDITVRLVAGNLPASTLVDEIMTREVVTCRPDDELAEAEERMARNRKSRIMCVDDDERLVGVISLSDLAQLEPAGRVSDTLRRVTTREARP